MDDVEFKQGPLLAGWAIAAGAALVALGVSLVVMKFDLTPAVAIAAVLFLIVGVILGLPRADGAGGLGTGAADGTGTTIGGSAAIASGVTIRSGTSVPASAKVSAPHVEVVPEARITAVPASAPAVAPKSNHVSFLAPVMPEATDLERGTAGASSVTSSPAAFIAARKPEAMAAARGGLPDDLKQIKGVGPVLEKLLHTLGYFHFDQIAAWTAAEIAWVDENLEGFKGRVTRDDWVPQARILAAGGETEFSRRVEDGEVY
jgi:predicted flap endonuclease-1-like 5' DNA nuclease